MLNGVSGGIREEPEDRAEPAYRHRPSGGRVAVRRCGSRLGRGLARGGSRRFRDFVETGEKKELTDVYYDTEDWKLYRTGYTLRIRKLDRRRYEATIKSLASATSGDDARRRGISEPLGGEEPGVLLGKKRPGSVGKPLRALVGTRELRPLFEVRTRRRIFDLFEVQTGGADGSVDGRDNDSLGEVLQDASGNI